MGTKFDEFPIPTSSNPNDDSFADVTLGFSSHTDAIYIQQGDSHITLDEHQLLAIVRKLLWSGAINSFNIGEPED